MKTGHSTRKEKKNGGMTVKYGIGGAFA